MPTSAMYASDGVTIMLNTIHIGTIANAADRKSVAKLNSGSTSADPMRPTIINRRPPHRSLNRP